MLDPRVMRHAQVLVHYSTQVHPGDRVFVEAEPIAAPLVRAVYQQVLEAGGHPHLLMNLPGLTALFLEHANDEQIDFVPTFQRLAYEEFDVRIRIHSASNTKDLTNVDEARFARRQKALEPILHAQMERGARKDLRWMTTLFPTLAYAQDAEMSLEEYESFVYRACHVADPEKDPVAYWKKVQAEQQAVVDAFWGKDRVEIHGPNCDLKLSIKDRIFLNGCGEHNMPDGEIYTGPVEESVNGWIRFTYPAVWLGTMVSGVELEFERGKVVTARSETNQPFFERMLDTDPGARYVGEFAIGTNFGIQEHTRNILFDEKIGGSIHLALGAGYPETGSKNKSAIHWDMICDMKQDAQIQVDGETIYENGAFQL